MHRMARMLALRHRGLLALGLFVALAVPVCAGEWGGKLVALVAKRPVTLRDVAARLALDEIEPAKATREQWQNALAEAIDHQVLLEAAGRGKVAVGEAEVDRAIRRLRSGPRAKDYLREIRVLGLSAEQERARMREQLRLERWLSNRLASKLFVPPAAVRKWYDDHKSELVEPETRTARVLTAQINADRTEDAARAKMKSMLQQLRAGKSFAEVATGRSEDPWARKGGLMAPLKKGGSGSVFEAEVFKLAKPGEVSEPFRTNVGLHAVKLETIRAGGTPEFKDKQEIIRLGLRRELKARHLVRLAAEWRRKITVRVFWDQLPGKGGGN
jgi:parvulin-like peptidyl-prolyl isomerase